MSYTCSICQNEEYVIEITCKDFTVSQKNFDIVSCKNCGFWQTYLVPEQSEISNYYESEQYISHSDKKESFFDKIYHLVRRYAIIQKTNLVKRHVPQGTILDFGCGTGYFLEHCKKNGFEVFGIEPNSTARNIAAKKDIPVYDNINFIHGKKFDAISLWHVLEHLYNPKQYIETFYNLLNKKGILILALPNRNSYDAKKYKEYWAGYDVPRHLSHFTEKDLVNLTKDNFRLLEKTPMYFDAFYVSMLSEKYMGSKNYFFNGLYYGLVSNIRAVKSAEYSSLIYVFQKK